MRRIAFPLLTAVLALLAAATLVAAFAGSGADQTNPHAGRPLVVFIHGRAQEARETADLRKEWYAAFQQGLDRAGYKGLLADGDYDMVFYQTLYRNGAVPTCMSDQIRRTQRLAPLRDRKKRAEAELASARQRLKNAETRAQAQAAAAAGGAAGGGGGRGGGAGRGGFPAVISELAAAEELVDKAESEIARVDGETRSAEAGEAATVAADDSAFTNKFLAVWDALRVALTSAAARSGIVRDVVLDFVTTDTKRYVTNRVYRCATNATLAAVLQRAKESQRPVVLVAHSMGTLVTFDFLKDVDNAFVANPNGRFNVTRFVSLGSQLGVDEFVEGLLGFPPRFHVPGSIATWVNLRGDNDYLSPRLMNQSYEFAGLEFLEFLIPTTLGHPHDVSGYLSNVAAARAIAFGWCQSFAAGTGPAGCDRVEDVSVGAGGASRPR